MPIRFPGESPSYRTARNKLLAAEVALRGKTEDVAALRRKMPLGGKLKQDYAFEEGGRDMADKNTVRTVHLSDLFGDKDTLVLYSYMYGPNMDAPCPMCTSFLDGLDAQAPHISQTVALAVTAKSPIARIREFARGRGWQNLRLVSSHGTTYQHDYHGETAGGDQMPMMNIFVKRKGKIHHFWASEMLHAKSKKGTDSRHIDAIWPLWNVLDLTPGGRGKDWYPALEYK
jgi:predicted dithiol-disulfide oxidoreductase (DUF899 family)